MTAQRKAPKVKVYVNGKHETNVHCLDAQFGAGAEGLPRALVEVQPQGRKAGRREFLDQRFTDFEQHEVEIVIGDEVVHWGKTLAQPVAMSGATGDHVTLASRMEKQHFGGALIETFFYSPSLNAPVSLSLPTVFNPDIDGATIGNRSVQTTGMFGKANMFIHEESSRTAASRKFHKSPPLYWTLPQAVFYLCWNLNRFEKHITNPTLNELKEVLPEDDTSLVRNHEAPFGDHLPEQLDKLLNPLGYAWNVEFIARGERKIRVYRRGMGEPREVRMQAPGETVNVNQTNLESFSGTADVSSRAFNAVHVMGDFEEVEGTFVLVPGWPKQYDDYWKTAPADLRKNADAWLTNPILALVGRLWVLNEAGDYIGTRPSIKKPYSLTGLFDTFHVVERRRKLLPCATIKSDGSPVGHAGGVFLEWNEIASPITGSTGQGWKPADQLGYESRQFRVLDKECGIYFDGQEIPFEIALQGTENTVRVTACLESDKRVQVDRLPPAFPTLLKDGKSEVIDVASRFKKRTRHKSSRFVGQPHDVDTRDDTPSMKLLADQLLSNWNQASINGTLTLTGIDYAYSNVIGATISGINGRKIDFNISPAGKKYPSVVSCRINFSNQSIELTLDTPAPPQTSITDDWKSQNALGRDRR